MNILENKELYRVSGRTTRQEGALYLGYSAAFIEFSFRGIKVEAEFVTDRLDWEEFHRAQVAVFVNGEEKPFTTKEFDLLTYLAENPNRVFTKDELFREIWDMDSVGDIATVTVHIKKVREKIEADTTNPQYIETIWGVGYRFKA